MVERTTYLRKDLLELRWSGHGLLHSIPAELKVAYRGCRAGAKVKARTLSAFYPYGECQLTS